MSASKIEWTDRSDWNPVRGCTRVSPGCGGPGPQGGCYAEAMAARFSDPGQWGHGYAVRTQAGGRWTGKVELMEDRLTLPLRWRRPAKVFASSTSDVFHEKLRDDEIDKIFAVMALCPHLTFQVLTKRADRMRAYLSDPATSIRVGGECLAHVFKAVQRDPKTKIGSGVMLNGGDVGAAGLDPWPLPNVWLGVSVERQQEADERIPELLQTPAAVRFLSCEPLLGPVDLNHVKFFEDRQSVAWESALNGKRFNEADGPDLEGYPKVDWVIVGGESGDKARPMHPDWARSLRDQCFRADIAFFFKQWGEWHPSDATDHPADCQMRSIMAFEADHAQNYRPGEATYWALNPGWQGMCRIGRKTAGRLLDGVEHSAFPVQETRIPA